MSGEASEQREKMAEGAWSLFREHSEYKLESHLLGPSCLAVVFTKMGLSNDLFFFFSFRNCYTNAVVQKGMFLNRPSGSLSLGVHANVSPPKNEDL